MTAVLTRVRGWWADASASLWFVPSIMTASAVLLAALLVELDARLLADGRTDLYLAFSGGVEGSRALLGAIAGTTITVTGTVFSITVVALQLAASQYSSRVLRNFMSDRGSQVVLGVFIGTFTYALLVLRTVRSANEDGQAFVPSIAVAAAILLALLSVVSLIYFIDHAAKSIQASSIIDRAARDTLSQVRRLFPEAPPDIAQTPAIDSPPSVERESVRATASGYVQTLNTDVLFELGNRRSDRLSIHFVLQPGDFVLPGSTLASVWPGSACDEDTANAVRTCVTLGPQRTLSEDVEFGLVQLADIAVRALSPGVNDPTTAVNCIDRIAEVLVALGTRHQMPWVQTDDSGRVRVVVPRPTFARATAASFEQIRHYGVKDPVVAAHLLYTLGEISALVPERHHEVLEEHIEATVNAARAALSDRVELEHIEVAAARARVGYA